MRATAAQVSVERLPDLLIGGMAGPSQQCDGGDHHPVGAVAALRGLFLEEGTLHRMQFLRRPQSFQGRDRTARGFGDRQLAGLHRLGTQEHRARTTLLQAATELRAVQPSSLRST